MAAVHGLCADETIIGTPFYVMDMVEGRIFCDATLPDLQRPERAAIFDAMNDTIARLHGVDSDAVGLGSFGRRGGYFERQIGDGRSSISTMRMRAGTSIWIA